MVARSAMASFESPLDRLADGTALPRLPSLSVSRKSQVDRSTTHKVSRGESGMSGQKSGRNDGNDVSSAVEFIRRQHPVKTGAAFEAETGISAETFRKWSEGAGRPSFGHYTTLIRVYGAGFLCAVMGKAPDWIEEARIAFERRCADEEIARIEAENEQREQRLSELRERQREFRASL